MRGQKRVEDARRRAYDPRIHLLRKTFLRRWTDCRVKPGSDGDGLVPMAVGVTQRPAVDAPAWRSCVPGLASLARDTRLTSVMARAFLAITCYLLLAPSASAQSFPSHPLRMIVPAPPAGITALSARLVGEGLRAKFSQPAVLRNKSAPTDPLGFRQPLHPHPHRYTPHP